MYWSLENVPWTNLHDLNLDWIVNTMKQTVEQWIAYHLEMDGKFADFTEQVNSDFDEFTAGINEWKTLIENEFTDLQTYVQNYFNNLDLNESTRYVINQMIASGEFIEVLNPSIVSTVEQWLANHITPTTPVVDDTLTISGAAAGAKVTGDKITTLKSDLNDTTSGVTKILDNSYSRSNIAYDGYDMDRALTASGKEVLTGSVILSFPVTAGDLIKVNLTNRTNGDILYFFQDTKNVPWDSNTHIIGIIHRGASFTGYLVVPTGATHIVTNANTAQVTSYVYNVRSFLPMKYYGQLSSGNYTDTEAGVYAVSRANVSGLPSEMSQDYGWLISYVKNNLYVLIESNTPKTIWLKEGGSDWIQIHPSGASGSNRLGGKLIAYNGDSIAESRFSGFASNGGGYPYLISQIVGGTYENKAVSGGTLAVSSATHHVCETISTMTNNADIICFDGGINDYWLDVPLGDFSESDFTGAVDNTTVCGALESIFRQAINKWTGKPIVFVIVHKITTTAWTRNGAGYTFAEARQKIIRICEKYSIPYVDMWADGGLNAYMAALDNAFLNGGANTHPDGCHPDVNGYQKYYVPRLIAKFESLLPYDT